VPITFSIAHQGATILTSVHSNNGRCENTVTSQAQLPSKGQSSFANPNCGGKVGDDDIIVNMHRGCNDNFGNERDKGVPCQLTQRGEHHHSLNNISSGGRHCH